jgi:hypothetical protein
MDENQSTYLRSCIQFLKYSQLEKIICFCSDSKRLHKLMLNMGNLCPKGNGHSSILEDYFKVLLGFSKGQLESKKKVDGDLQ